MNLCQYHVEEEPENLEGVSGDGVEGARILEKLSWMVFVARSFHLILTKEKCLLRKKLAKKDQEK